MFAGSTVSHDYRIYQRTAVLGMAIEHMHPSDVHLCVKECIRYHKLNP
jgi:hypothetical protein